MGKNDGRFQNIFGFKAEYDYQYGYCMVFALALHEAYGLPIYAIDGCDNSCHHCFCVTPDGFPVDSLGIWDKRASHNAKDFAPEHVTGDWTRGRLVVREITPQVCASWASWREKESHDEARLIVTTLPQFTCLAGGAQYAEPKATQTTT